MKWLFRPSLLVLASAALAVVAGVVVLSGRVTEAWPEPKAVREGEQEIVWLYAATNATAWERFVTAVRKAAEQLQGEYPGLDVKTDEKTFPGQTTAVPELSLSVGANATRLVFRWYKLTSTQKTQGWVQALVERKPPPLAIIGGNTSDLAIELARQLREMKRLHPDVEVPLLLLTTATTDRVQGLEQEGTEKPAEAEELWGVPLQRIYDQRTFRFCFTNQQMADAVTDFIWSRDELRPDSDPAYSVAWQDDPYSKDLNVSFRKALELRVALAFLQEWAWRAESATTGRFPFGFDQNLAALAKGYSQFRAAPYAEPRIDSSVGTFSRPNRFEVYAAESLMDDLERNAGQQQPLLLLSGQTQPSRRFLHALRRISPRQARRMVVATGDAIAFNTLYRDRNVAWPIQDLPFSLVSFCHRNPVDRAAGFQPAEDADPATAVSGLHSATGTEDLLLYRDIVEALVQAVYQGEATPADAGSLRERLSRLRLVDGRLGFDSDGRLLFDNFGNRHGGTGEHVVWLRPSIERGRVKPEATITVWASQPGQPSGRRWRPAGKALQVDYDRGFDGGNAHAD